MKTKTNAIMVGLTTAIASLTAGALAQTTVANLTFNTSNPDNQASYPGITANAWTGGSYLPNTLGGTPFGTNWNMISNIGSGSASLDQDWITIDGRIYNYLSYGSSFNVTDGQTYQINSLTFDYQELLFSNEDWQAWVQIGSTSWLSGTVDVPLAADTGSFTVDTTGMTLSPGNNNVTVRIVPAGQPPIGAGENEYLSSGVFYGFDMNSTTNARIINERGDPVSDYSVYFRIDNFVMDVTAIPEPSSAFLVGLSALGLLARRRR